MTNEITLADINIIKKNKASVLIQYNSMIFFINKFGVFTLQENGISKLLKTFDVITYDEEWQILRLIGTVIKYDNRGDAIYRFTIFN